jgi:hypothetical protein
VLGSQAITSGGGSVNARIAQDSAFAKDAPADDWAQTELRLEVGDSFVLG